MDILYQQSNGVMAQQMALIDEIDRLRASVEEIKIGQSRIKDGSKSKEKTGADTSIFFEPED